MFAVGCSSVTAISIRRNRTLGARGVLLGRAWLYAMAAGGEAGVARLLDLIDREMRVAMTLTGVSSVSAINNSILADLIDNEVNR